MFELTGEDRSLRPSPRRLAEARRSGHAPRSRELTSAAAACGAAAALGLVGGDLWTAATGLLQTCWSAPVTRLADMELSARLGPDIGRLLLPLAAIVGMPALAAVLVAALQAGCRVRFQRLAPRWSHVSPGSGWRRIRAGAGFLPCGGLCLKIATAGLIAAWMLRGDSLRAVSSEPASIAAAIGGSLIRLGLLMAAVAAMLGVGDWFYRRALFTRGLRMTPSEARTEARDATPRRRPRTSRPDRVSHRSRATTSARDGTQPAAGEPAAFVCHSIH